MSDSSPSPHGGIHLSTTDIAVLGVLVEKNPKILSRESLSRMAGLENDSARRVDSSLVMIRRILGPDSIVTVRRRGWMIAPQSLAAAIKALDSQI